MLSKLFNTDSSLFCHSRVEHFLSEENSNIEFKALQERQFHIRENFGTKKIQRICNRCAVQPIRLHDFRHSHMALLIDNGENITVKRKGWDMLVSQLQLIHMDIYSLINKEK
ncbi:hypothetical protein HCA87_01185 [Listeria welshimeri]|nr:hypothetical protein [Listeria welshimeri]